MKPRLLFVTGSDTGVGKTVLATLLVRHLRERGVRVAGLKPLCSGDRNDAQALRTAANNVLALDDVNPWHFRAPLSPLLAARRERRSVRLREVVAHTQQVAGAFECVVVEGAGGLLSPLGEDFDSRDLIVALRARPLVVCANRLGAVNQTRLVLAALPARFAREAQVILSTAARDAASDSNTQLLGECLGANRVHRLPLIKSGPMPRFVKTTLAAMMRWE